MKLANDNQALVYDEKEGDYTLKGECDSVWVVVDNISIWIRRHDRYDCVEVDAFYKGKEIDPAECGFIVEMHAHDVYAEGN